MAIIDDSAAARETYVLDEQVGYLLRLANQRHALIFQQNVQDGLTPTQFSTLLRIDEHGEVSQNHLGRLSAIDVATIKGVVDRLRAKGLVKHRPDAADKRRSLISLTPEGEAMIAGLKQLGSKITAETLAPLNEDEQATFLALLRRLL